MVVSSDFLECLCGAPVNSSVGLRYKTCLVSGSNEVSPSLYAFAITLVLSFSSYSAGQRIAELGLVGGEFGVDGRRCETTKAEFGAIGQVANERDSNVIIIARLGARERMRSLNILRLGQVRDWLLMVQGYSRDRIVIAEGERVRGLSG